MEIRLQSEFSVLVIQPQSVTLKSYLTDLSGRPPKLNAYDTILQCRTCDHRVQKHHLLCNTFLFLHFTSVPPPSYAKKTENCELVNQSLTALYDNPANV